MSAVVRRQRDRILDMLLEMGPFASTLGLAGLFVTITLGFEQPNQVLLAASSSLLLITPLVVFLHVVLTSHLTRARKRTWLRALLGPRAIVAMSRYLQLGKHWGSSERRHGGPDGATIFG